MESYFQKGDISFRPVDVGDLDLLAEHRNSPDVWGNLTSPLPVFKSKQPEWLDSINHGNSDYYFMAYSSEELVGLLRLTDIDWQNRNAAVGLDIFDWARGQGYAHRCFATLVEYCFTVLSLKRLWLLVLDTNTRATNVYKKAGFQEEGVMRKHIYRNGRYSDYILMGLLKDEFKNSTI